MLIGFNIRPDETARRLAENEGVDLRFYQVIYEIEDDLKKAMRGMLAPIEREVMLGRAEVRQIFKVSKVGTIVGCYVTSGKITRNAKVRVVRDASVVFDGELENAAPLQGRRPRGRRGLRVRHPGRAASRTSRKAT